MLFTDERYDGIDKVNLTTAFEIVSDSKPCSFDNSRYCFI